MVAESNESAGKSSAVKPPTGARKRRMSDAVMDAIHSVEKKVEEVLTVLWDDLEDWQRDNHFIVSGYRPASYSFKKSLWSLTHFHNETVNVYTHLIGAIVFNIIGLYAYYVLPPRYTTATNEDVLVFAAFFLGDFLCLGMSATYHLFSNHSQAVAYIGNRLDYLGIVCMIAGSYVPSLYYGFYCSPHHRNFYWTLTAVLGLACMTVTLLPAFRTPKWRPFRAGMYVAYGSFGIIAFFDGVNLYGMEELMQRMQVKWVLAQGGLYVLGAVIYACRIPERWKQGTFDLVGASHQIFHVLVLMAAGTHLVGLVKAFDYLHAEGRECVLRT